MITPQHLSKIDQNTKALADVVSAYTRQLLAEEIFSESILASLVLNYQIMMLNILDIFEAGYVDKEDNSDDIG